MKKVFAIFAIAALIACGGTSTEVKTDSTTVTVDSTAIVTDTTAVGGGVAGELSTEGKAEAPAVENIK
jgi:calcineurin-like phosphoesterase